MRSTSRTADESPGTRPRRRPRRVEAAASSRGASARRALRWALLCVSVIVAVDGIAGDKGLIEMLRARRRDAALAGAIARLRIENARLREEARRLKEDPAAVEALARKELGLIRPGEVLFVVRDRTK